MHAYMFMYTHRYIITYTPYSGFFPEVLILPNFLNELFARDILFLTADCFKRADRVIMHINCIRI